MNTPIETERKFLIEYPNDACLTEFRKGRILHIVQTYLDALQGCTRRVRKITENERVSYIFTEKRRISTLSAYENEYEISADRYTALLKEAAPDRNSIEKVRYVLPYGDKKLEMDLYPFWSDRAILEIELANESESVTLPDYVKILREVTEDPRYKNVNLAKTVVYETIARQP